MSFSTSSDSDSVLSEINITPLVDVMLVLLVAFIVTAPLMTNAVKVNLPEAAETSPPEDNKAHTLTVGADGVIYLDKNPVQEETVEATLISMHTAKPDMILQLQADESVNYGKVAKVMAVIERSGITRLSVLTLPQ
ncbi:MAG TPA: biopolymer transporter ExbD [Dongiaceae bacterium]|nr:biopolymer transporter ExbD [Dongiaceae bacterium]